MLLRSPKKWTKKLLLLLEIWIFPTYTYLFNKPDANKYLLVKLDKRNKCSFVCCIQIAEKVLNFKWWTEVWSIFLENLRNRKIPSGILLHLLADNFHRIFSISYSIKVFWRVSTWSYLVLNERNFLKISNLYQNLTCICKYPSLLFVFLRLDIFQSHGLFLDHCCWHHFRQRHRKCLDQTYFRFRQLTSLQRLLTSYL